MNAPTAPVDQHNAEHYLWGDVCDGWHLLKQPDLSVIRERVPPGAAERRHRHGRARQCFVVLSGRARIEFDEHAVSFGPGQSLHVPPGVAHRFVNDGETDVEFLVISSPSTAGDRTNLEPVR